MGGHGICDQATLGKRGNQSVEIVESQEEVDFRHLVPQVLLIPLDETSHTDNRFDLPPLLERGSLQQRVNGLLLGGVDETAGVDEDHIGGLDILNDRRTVTYQIADQTLRVNGGFVAT
jgi:hypothetical protein